MELHFLVEKLIMKEHVKKNSFSVHVFNNPKLFCEFVAKPLIMLGVSLMTLNNVQIASIAQAIYYFAILYLPTKYISNMKQYVFIFH